jgi:hypothetical protein
MRYTRSGFTPSNTTMSRISSREQRVDVALVPEVPGVRRRARRDIHAFLGPVELLPGSPTCWSLMSFGAPPPPCIEM